jgi:hypothetical protein
VQGLPPAPSPNPIRVQRFFLLLSLIPALQACSRPVQAEGQSPFRYAPPIEVVGKKPALPEPQQVARWELGRLIPDGWSARGTAEVRMVNDASQPEAAMIIDPGARGALDVRNLPDLKTDRVRLRMRGGPCRVKVEFRAGRRSLGTTRTAILNSPTSFTDLDLDAPFLGRAINLPDRLIIRISGAHQQVQLSSLTLLKVAPAEWLPRPGANPWVSIREDQRRATGLLSSTPLRVRFRGVGDARLEFSFGIPPEAAGEVDARLEVKLWPERGSPRESSYPVNAHQNGVPWQSVHMDIPRELDGQKITATFRLIPKKLSQAGLALTPPQLVRAAGHPSILLMTVDGLRADAVTTPGGAPLIEEAQRNKMVRVLQTPSTSPRVAAAAIMTGQSPIKNGVLLDTERLTKNTRTLASQLSRAGYLTLALVDDPRLGHGSGLLEDFDRVYAPAKDATVEELGAQAARWMADLPPTPVFIWLHASDALPPYDPKPRFIRRFPDQVGDLEFLPPKFRPPGSPDVKDARVVRVHYRAEIAEIERELSRLIARGRMRSSIWALVGLRGQGHGESDAWWRSDRLTPEILRVPVLSLGIQSEQLLEGLGEGVSSLGRVLLDTAGLRRLEFPSGAMGTPLTFLGNGSRVALAGKEGLGILTLKDNSEDPAAHRRHAFHWIGSQRTPQELDTLHKSLLLRLGALKVQGIKDCSCPSCAGMRD